MPVGQSSRVYSSSALEMWFGHVALEWESLFSADALRKGREIYRNGQISGIELTDQQAIIHCAFTRKDTCYVVLEWNPENKPIVRCSKEDAFLGNAVTVGGLYEIEELIADEIDPLPREPKPEKKDEAKVASTVAKAAVSEKPVSAPARLLKLYLGVVGTGLRLTVYWMDEKLNREAAFRENATPVSSVERELIVRLTALAKETGFKFRREANDFLMSGSECITAFFSAGYKRWKTVFEHMELNPDAQLLAEGIKKITLSGSAKSVGKGSMRIDWRLKLGNRWLDREDAVRLVRVGPGTHVVKGLGLVHVSQSQAETFKEWQVAAASVEESDCVWPRYMVFSLFGEYSAELSLEQTLQNWRENIQTKQPTSDRARQSTVDDNSLPDFLRPYQAYGVRWMANLRAQKCHGLLADEMGLGKTVQVLTLLKIYPFGHKDSLVVCPASVVPVWQSEAGRWYPELEVAILSSQNTFTSPSGSKQPKLWIASYTQLRRHKHLLNEFEFGYAVLDEAQQIKNPEAKVTHACCAIQAECRFALTGTPIENRLLDMWTLFRFIMPGLLGSRRRFETAATSTDPEVRKRLEQTLRKQIAPFLLRRRKDAVGKDLPPKVVMDLVCPITEIQRQVYERLLNEGGETMGSDLKTMLQSQPMGFFTLLTRLRQVCCDPGLIPKVNVDPMQSGKIQMLLTRLQEAMTEEGARKAVVFSQFVQLLRRIKPLIKKKFPEVELLELTGNTKDRSKPVEIFQQKKGAAIILVSLRAGGTGITLHAADYVFLLDPWWNPAIEEQAIDRVHRIGQRKHVFVYRMITQGTIEQRIQQLKAEKRELFENTLGNLNSTGDLLDHFRDLEELARLL